MQGRAFIHLALIASLCLQRFGIPLGSSAAYVSAPVFVLALAWMMLRGFARFNRRALWWYLLMATWFSAVYVIAELFPDASTDFSIKSLLFILFTYAIWTVEPTRRFDTSQTLDVFLSYARVLSVLGIAQYLAQFVGVSFFSFGDRFPALSPVLVERYWNYHPVVQYGSPLMRSNGLLLVEPATLSQVIVLAVSIEIFIKRRFKFLPVYALSYLFTYAGTGILSFVVVMMIYALFSIRNMRRVLVVFAAMLCAGLIVAMVAPELFGRFAQRATEIESTGSSANARYVGAVLSLREYLHDPRTYLGYGPGASERSMYAVAGSNNTITKLVVDYGFVGLTLFWAYCSRVLFRRSEAILPILSLVILVVGGGYLLFTPHVILTTVLCIWSRVPRSSIELEPATAALRPQALEQVAL